MRPEDKDPGCLLDIVLAARKAVEYLGDRDAVALEADELVLSAIEHNLIIIGEAARKVSPAFHEQHPEIGLGKAIGMRNILVHEYGRVDVDEVWRTVQEDLPALVVVLESLLPPKPAGQ